MCDPSFIGSLSSSNHSSSRSCSSYASILCGKILGSSRGIPFADIANDDMMAPSGHLPLLSPELVKQPSVQLQSCSAVRFNEVAREVHNLQDLATPGKLLCRQGFLILVILLQSLKILRRVTFSRSTSCLDLHAPLDRFQLSGMSIRRKS